MRAGLPLQDRGAGAWGDHSGLWERELSAKQEQSGLQDRSLKPRSRGFTVPEHRGDLS